MVYNRNPNIKALKRKGFSNQGSCITGTLRELGVGGEQVFRVQVLGI